MATAKDACVLRALMDHAKLLETTGPQLPVSFPEPATPFNKPADGKWLEFQFFPNDLKWQGLTSGRLDQGLVQLGVCWPKYQGLVAPTEAVGQVKAHFAKNTVLFHNGWKVTLNAEPRQAQQLDQPDGVKIPVIIAWQA